MSQLYDPTRDYRSYLVTDADQPLLSKRDAASELGQSEEAIRSMIIKGRLPARRDQTRYRAPYLIPRWAVDGKKAGAPDAEDHRAQRVRELEDALTLLRAAREHEQRAFQLQSEAMQELQAANEILSRAVGNVIVPSSPPKF
jgi:hypothetical protein